MSLNNPVPGSQWVSELQGAGTLWLTSSVTPSTGIPNRHDLPTLAKNVTVSNNDPTFANSVSFATTLSGTLLTTNTFLLQGRQAVSIDIKAKSIFIKSENNAATSYSIAAALTNIHTRSYYENDNITITWSPLNFSPTTWLKSDTGLVLNGSKVSQWNDQSGNNNHFTQSTAERQPILTSSLYNNLPGVWWGYPTAAAIDTKKMISTNSYQISNDIEWYVIAYISTEDYTAQLARPVGFQTSFALTQEDDGYTNRYQMSPSYTTADMYPIFIPGGVTQRLTSYVTKNVPILLSLRRNGNIAKGILDNNVVSTARGTNMSTARQFVLGGVRVNDTTPFAGSMFEIITFNRYLSTNERYALLYYFSRRYNQSWIQ